jgi:hypothetical protein
LGISATARFFDSLPSNVREAIREYPFKIEVHNIARMIRFLGGDRVAEYITASTPKTIVSEALKDFGTDHPQAKEVT